MKEENHKSIFRSFLTLLKRKPLPTYLVLCGPIFLNVGFGLYPVIVKLFASGTAHKANGFILTLYRGVGATLVLFFLSYFIEGPIHIPDLRMTMAFASFGFFVVFLGQTLYIAGVYMVGPDVSSSIQPLIAIWTSVISVCCCEEKVPSLTMVHTYAKVFGVLIAVGGAVNVFSGVPASDDRGEQAMGYTVLILDTLCGSIFLVLQKKFVFNRQNSMWKEYPIAVTAYTYLFGSIFMSIANLYFVFTSQTQVFILPRQSLLALVYAVFVNSAFCYFLITWSNKHLPSSVVTAFWPVQMLVTTVTAYVIFGDELTIRQCLGAACIIAGLALVLYYNYVDERITAGGTGQDCCCGKSNPSSKSHHTHSIMSSS